MQLNYEEIINLFRTILNNLQYCVQTVHLPFSNKFNYEQISLCIHHTIAICH